MPSATFEVFLKELDDQAIKYELDPATLSLHSENTLGETKAISCIVYPKNQEHIVVIVKAAKVSSISYHCVSLGKNWGFGDKLSVSGDPSVLIDLHLLNSIDHFDKQSGLITVGPGVSLGMMRAFLQEQGGQFMAPVLGTPDIASVLGNLLDRGHSITPLQNRVDSLVGLEAVLPSGEVYTSYAEEAPFYPDGMGASLDGLFVQSSLGIVTKATLQLVPHMEQVKGIFIDIHSSSELEKAFNALQKLQCTFFGQPIVYRFVPRDYLRRHAEHIKEGSFPFGMLMVAVGGNKALVNVIMHATKKAFFSYEYVSHEKKKLNALYTFLLSFKQVKFVQSLLNKISIYRFFLRSSSGELITSDYIYASFGVDSRISYEKHEKLGILMFQGVLPHKGEKITAFLREVEIVCQDNAIENACSISSNTAASSFVSFPLLFQKQDISEKEKMFSVYIALCKALRNSEGYVPRLPISHMYLFKEWYPAKSSFLKKIKEAIDPELLFAKGRYE